MGELAADRPVGVVAAVPHDLAERVLAQLCAATVVVGPDDTVVLANPAAAELALVRAGRLDVPALAALVAEVRADGVSQERELTLPARPTPPLRLARPDATGPAVRVTAAAVAEGFVALVLDDVTEARRVEAVRRDFVANVSHELKTPVGALALLAEAIRESSGQPEQVRRFVERLGHETRRLSRLVQELIDLSRLQGAEAPPALQPVAVVRVVAEAVDRTRLVAEAKSISVAVVGDDGEEPLEVLGDEGQLVTAVANLVDNAVKYSPEGTRVVVGVCRREDIVEISVADEGIGIAESDLDRVFERFYRADPARSRATGGTGLGLAIVKHIVTNHGGLVTVWSSEGAGSTFTVRLPAAGEPR